VNAREFSLFGRCLTGFLEAMGLVLAISGLALGAGVIWLWLVQT
jgi:hypothetical protein